MKGLGVAALRPGCSGVALLRPFGTKPDASLTQIPLN
jgi:hypothetical protein